MALLFRRIDHRTGVHLTATLTGLTYLLLSGDKNKDPSFWQPRVYLDSLPVRLLEIVTVCVLVEVYRHRELTGLDLFDSKINVLRFLSGYIARL